MGTPRPTGCKMMASSGSFSASAWMPDRPVGDAGNRTCVPYHLERTRPRAHTATVGATVPRMAWASAMTTEPPGFERALATFRRAAREVPAYADFLRRNGVAAECVRTPRDFASVPPVTKANYLRHYPLNMLVWRGDMTEAGTWST